MAHEFEKKWRSEDVKLQEKVDFSALLLNDRVLYGLTNAGFKKPSPIQLEAIPVGRFGKDLLVQAKSGTGKTLVFVIVALEMLKRKLFRPQVMILVPTREIATQICSVVKSVGSAFSQLTCHSFIGGFSVVEDKEKSITCQIAVGTPGRIKQLISMKCLPTNAIRLLVFDEADQLFEGSFKQDMEEIFNTLPHDKQVIATSATYPPKLAKHIFKILRDPHIACLNSKELALLGIVHYAKVVEFCPMPLILYRSKLEALGEILKNIKFSQCLVFCNGVQRVDVLYKDIKKWGFSATYISSAKEQADRLKAIDRLKHFKCKVLVTSDLTSRGIDAENVDLVVNFDMANGTETYMHRVGRAGRYGSVGVAITIITEREMKFLKKVEEEACFKAHKLPEPVPLDLIQNPLFVEYAIEEPECVTKGEKSVVLNGIKTDTEVGHENDAVEADRQSAEKELKIVSSGKEILSGNSNFENNENCGSAEMNNDENVCTKNANVKSVERGSTENNVFPKDENCESIQRNNLQKEVYSKDKTFNSGQKTDDIDTKFCEAKTGSKDLIKSDVKQNESNISNLSDYVDLKDSSGISVDSDCATKNNEKFVNLCIEDALLSDVQLSTKLTNDIAFSNDLENKDLVSQLKLNDISEIIQNKDVIEETKDIIFSDKLVTAIELDHNQEKKLFEAFNKKSDEPSPSDICETFENEEISDDAKETELGSKCEDSFKLGNFNNFIKKFVDEYESKKCKEVIVLEDITESTNQNAEKKAISTNMIHSLNSQKNKYFYKVFKNYQDENGHNFSCSEDNENVKEVTSKSFQVEMLEKDSCAVKFIETQHGDGDHAHLVGNSGSESTQECTGKWKNENSQKCPEDPNHEMAEEFPEMSNSQCTEIFPCKSNHESTPQQHYTSEKENTTEVSCDPEYKPGAPCKLLLMYQDLSDDSDLDDAELSQLKLNAEKYVPSEDSESDSSSDSTDSSSSSSSEDEADEDGYHYRDNRGKGNSSSGTHCSEDLTGFVKNVTNHIQNHRYPHYPQQHAGRCHQSRSCHLSETRSINRERHRVAAGSIFESHNLQGISRYSREVPQPSERRCHYDGKKHACNQNSQWYSSDYSGLQPSEHRCCYTGGKHACRQNSLCPHSHSRDHSVHPSYIQPSEHRCCYTGKIHACRQNSLCPHLNSRDHSVYPSCLQPSGHRCHLGGREYACSQNAICSQWFKTFHNQYQHLQTMLQNCRSQQQ